MMNRKRYTRHTKWLALMSMGLWAGCSFFGDEPQDPASEIEPEFDEPRSHQVEVTELEPLELHDHVFELDAHKAPHLDATDRQWTISVDEAGSLTERQEGDVVAFPSEEVDLALRIDEIDRTDDTLHLYGAPPEPTDVIKGGKFEVYLPPMPTTADERIVDVGGDAEMAGDSDLAQRQQGLSYEHTLGEFAPSYSYDFGELSAFPVDLGPATVDFNGEFTFSPAIVATIEFSLNDIVAGVEVSGDVSLNAQWDIEAEVGFEDRLNWHIEIAERTFEIDPPILSPYDFTLAAFLEPDIAVSGEGEGEYRPEFSAEGYVRAGVSVGLSGGADRTFDSDFTTRRDFSGGNTGIGNANLNVSYGLDAGVALHMGTSTSGRKLAQAVPLSGNLSAGGRLQTNPPECPYEISFSVDSYVETFSPDNHWNYNWAGLDASGDILADGCQVETPPPECHDDIDCRDAGSPGENISGASMVCVENLCKPDADLSVTLNWDPEANLTLFMETPDGEVLSHKNPGPNVGSTGQMFQTSCGGCDEPETSEYTERAIHDGAERSDQFYIWVENPDGLHDPEDELERVEYRLQISHDGFYEELFQGTVDAEPGSKSLVYRYTVPSTSQPGL